MNQIRPPWTPEQVEALNNHQRSLVTHPFTCGNCRDTLGLQDSDGKYNDRVLIATPDGWRCATCDYQQAWAYDFMLEEPWDPFNPFNTVNS